MLAMSNTEIVDNFVEVPSIKMLKKGKNKFESVDLKNLFGNYSDQNLESMYKTLKQYEHLYKDQNVYLFFLAYEKGHQYNENCDKCKSEHDDHPYDYNCNECNYYHKNITMDIECKICKKIHMNHYFDENCINKYCIDNYVINKRVPCLGYDRRKRCNGYETCKGHVHGHKYSDDCKELNCELNIKNNGKCYGYKSIHHTRRNKSIQIIKCLEHCNCRCICRTLNCRFFVDIDKCNCVCDDNCKNYELQLGASEGSSMYDFVYNDDNTVIEPVEQMRYIGLRCLNEEFCFEVDPTNIIMDEMNYNKKITISDDGFIVDEYLKGDHKKGLLLYNASIEINQNTNLRYSNYNQENNYDTIGPRIANIHINMYTKDEKIAIQKIEGIFKNNKFNPNDSIAGIVIAHVSYLKYLFPHIYLKNEHQKIIVDKQIIELSDNLTKASKELQEKINCNIGQSNINCNNNIADDDGAQISESGNFVCRSLNEKNIKIYNRKIFEARSKIRLNKLRKIHLSPSEYKKNFNESKQEIIEIEINKKCNRGEDCFHYQMGRCMYIH